MNVTHGRGARRIDIEPPLADQTRLALTARIFRLSVPEEKKARLDSKEMGRAKGEENRRVSPGCSRD